MEHPDSPKKTTDPTQPTTTPGSTTSASPGIKLSEPSVKALQSFAAGKHATDLAELPVPVQKLMKTDHVIPTIDTAFEVNAWLCGLDSATSEQLRPVIIQVQHELERQLPEAQSLRLKLSDKNKLDEAVKWLKRCTQLQARDLTIVSNGYPDTVERFILAVMNLSLESFRFTSVSKTLLPLRLIHTMGNLQPTLVDLAISCDFEPHAAETLLDVVLKHCTHLKTLDLCGSDYPFQDKVIRGLVDGICTARKLVVGAGDAAFPCMFGAALSVLLHHNSKLEALECRNLKIDVESAKALSLALATNFTLVDLKIIGWIEADRSGTASAVFVEGLTLCGTSLRRVSIKGMPEKHQSKLAEIIEKSSQQDAGPLSEVSVQMLLLESGHGALPYEVKQMLKTRVVPTGELGMEVALELGKKGPLWVGAEVQRALRRTRSLSFKWTSSTDLGSLIPLLRRCTFLEQFDLRTYGPPPEKLNEVFAMLASLEHLSTFRLNMDWGPPSLASAKALTSYRNDHSYLQDTQSLCEFLQTSGSLKVLKLRGERVLINSASGTNWLCKSLAKNTKLDLDALALNCSTLIDDAKYLIKAIKACKGLKTLDISLNRFGFQNQVARSLIDKDCPVQILVVSAVEGDHDGNGGKFGIALGEMLECNASIVRLDCVELFVNVESAKALGAGLAKNRTLKTLNITKWTEEPEGSAAAVAFVEGLKTKTNEITIGMPEPYKSQMEQLVKTHAASAAIKIVLSSLPQESPI